MARFRLLAPHFDGVRYHEAGAIVDWPGPPSTQMEAVDDEGQARLEEFRRAPPQPVRSPDLLPRVVRDPMERQPGMPRAAGPPGQEPARSSDPANVVRTAEIVEETRQHAEKARERDAEIAEARAPRRRGRPARRAKPTARRSPAAETPEETGSEE